MSWLQLPDFHLFLIFTLVLTRLSGLVMSVPIFGTPEIPMQIRALLAFALTLLITPTQLGVIVSAPDTLIGYVIILASELAMGDLGSKASRSFSRASSWPAIGCSDLSGEAWLMSSIPQERFRI